MLWKCIGSQWEGYSAKWFSLGHNFAPCKPGDLALWYVADGGATKRSRSVSKIKEYPERTIRSRVGYILAFYYPTCSTT